MTPFVPLALFGFLPLVLYLFNRFPAQRAVVVSFVAGYLFLPQPGFGARYYLLQGIPPYEKISALSYCVLVATILFGSKRLSSFQPGWIDLPMLIWCLFCPLAAQFANGLSPISPTTAQIINWGVPYFLGRIYFNDLAGLRQLAVGIFAGGMAYVPLCLLEMRISPTLHLRVYGFHARADFGQTVRYGGYRPTVFLEHGLWVGMWMMTATLLGIVLWRTKVIKKLWNYPVNWLVLVLFVTFLLVKSTGAYLYLAIAIGIWFTSRWLRTPLPMLLISAVISLYLYLGATGELYKIPQVNDFLIASESSTNDRSQSLAFRIANEKLLSSKAQLKMAFGWGDGGGNRIYDASGKDISVTDSLWIIVFGQQGIVGLLTFSTMLLLPSLSFAFLCYPPSTWSNRKVAPAAGLALVLVLYLMDSSLNAMICPVFILANGGLAGLVLKEPETTKTKSIRAALPRRTLAQQR
ncbi:O-antigen ligase domain-containing protein [Nostoc sp. NMS4]|uniref:O-antigen ligase domain-containing protein n=1 Tax=Nostoc sp. NMS4 TaxID=2815390 RepID=UPI0025EAFF4C|nr:O-antigen ligase domain-containing protein [Nostoc sp. NMS4]MBN3926992.1 O-antigen ligase domain-containing protein [Nostoc sp. NMS4]